MPHCDFWGCHLGNDVKIMILNYCFCAHLKCSDIPFILIFWNIKVLAIAYGCATCYGCWWCCAAVALKRICDIFICICVWTKIHYQVIYGFYFASLCLTKSYRTCFFSCDRSVAWVCFHVEMVLFDYQKKTLKHVQIWMYMSVRFVYIYLLLLISMLWHRQAIFESKGDKLSSSAECRIRTQGFRHLFTSRFNACWQTGWAIEDQAKTWTRQPVPMISKHSAHSTSLPVGLRTWLCASVRIFIW